MQPPVAVLRYISKHSFTWVGNQISNKSALLSNVICFLAEGGGRWEKWSAEIIYHLSRNTHTKASSPIPPTRGFTKLALRKRHIRPIGFPSLHGRNKDFFLHPLLLCFTFLLAVSGARRWIAKPRFFPFSDTYFYLKKPRYYQF